MKANWNFLFPVIIFMFLLMYNGFIFALKSLLGNNCHAPFSSLTKVNMDGVRCVHNFHN